MENENSVTVTHDRLQAECFQWFWNMYPQYRRLLFAVLNEIKKLPCETRKQHMIRVNQAKAIGLVAGIWDMLFFYKGVLYAFDIKVGRDRLSDEQKDFARVSTDQGGVCLVVSSLLEFQEYIVKILAGRMVS